MITASIVGLQLQTMFGILEMEENKCTSKSVSAKLKWTADGKQVIELLSQLSWKKRRLHHPLMEFHIL